MLEPKRETVHERLTFADSVALRDPGPIITTAIGLPFSNTSNFTLKCLLQALAYNLYRTRTLGHP